MAALLAVLPVAAHADAQMKAYMDCARALGVAIHEKFAILAGTRSGADGLYVYTDESAYFVALGNPDARDRGAQDFLLHTNVSSVGDLFLRFRDRAPGSSVNVQPGVSYETREPSSSAGGSSYRPTPAIDVPDSRAREVLSRALREKVTKIKVLIDEKNYVLVPARAQAAFEKDRGIYLAKLEQCRIDGDRQLNFAVEEEVEKLRFGFPGVTLWERQVGTPRR
jgi:hypothetical protein